MRATKDDILVYIKKNLDKKLMLEEVAEYFDYSPSYFRKIFTSLFGCPFNQYISKLRLRQSVKMLNEGASIQEISKMYGYTSNSGFSNAFHREFGMSPRAFMKSNISVSAMLLQESIDGYPVTIKYSVLSDMTIEIDTMYEYHAPTSTLIDNMSYALMKDRFLRWKDENLTEKVGFWWKDESNHYFYVWGHLNLNKKSNKCYKNLSGGDYVIFDIKYPADMSNYRVSKLSSKLTRYIFEEWKFFNDTVIDASNQIFERYELYESEGHSYIYIPISTVIDEYEHSDSKQTGVDSWLYYIDQHILEDLTVKSLAEQFHYSEKHFPNIFHMYYQMNVMDYITKRRLYKLLEELKQDRIPMEKLLEKYHFMDIYEYEKVFEQVFGHKLKDYKNITIKDQLPVSLSEYYAENKYRIKMRLVELEDFLIMAEPVSDKIEGNFGSIDVIKLASERMLKDSAHLKRTSYKTVDQSKVNKIGLWIDDGNFSNKTYSYVVGPVVFSVNTIPKGMKNVLVEGGLYRVFTVEGESDKERLVETYQMMTKCVFYGWIKEHRVITDLRRLTFVRYRDEKLHFYVPVIG
ncbi:Transcriptional regulator, AraC family [Lachnospiraceae bacterium TWA4]|nr:Transcriptional regulator, AraC family [Lachnospiraceae bacterium TWA4]